MPPVTLLAGQVFSLLAITLSVYLARRFFDRRSFLSLGLAWDNHAWRDMAFGFVVSGLMMGVIYLIEWAVGWLTFDGFAWDVQSSSQVTFSVLTGLFLFLMVGWAGELLSRGYHLQNLADGLNLPWGVILSSGVFGLLHLGNPNSSFSAALGIFASGIFLAYGYLGTRKLWLPIGLHIGWNFFEGCVFGFQVSGLTGLPRLILQTVQGPEAFTGGAFGPEAGLVLIPGLLIGFACIYWYTKNRKFGN